MDFCGSNSTKTDNPRQFDPLGDTFWNRQTGKPWTAADEAAGYSLIKDRVSSNGPTGGVDQRNRIFNSITDMSPGLDQNANQIATRLQGASQDPGYSAAADQARKTISGGYLNGGPQLLNALEQYKSGVGKAAQGVRQRAAAGAADQGASVASQFQRVGQGLSTANQQAQQSGKAAAGARADETATGMENEANQFVGATKAQNYSAERARQAGGLGQLDQSIGSPLNYLSQIPGTKLAPLQSEGQLVQGLAAGGPTGQPNSLVYKNPGIYDYALSTIGALTGAGGVQGGGGGGGMM